MEFSQFYFGGAPALLKDESTLALYRQEEVEEVPEPVEDADVALLSMELPQEYNPLTDPKLSHCKDVIAYMASQGQCGS